MTERFSFFRKAIVVPMAAACLIGLGACGNDDDDEGDGGAVVLSTRLDTNPILVGQESKLTTEFSFSSDDIFDDDQNLVLVIKLPTNVKYKIGTAEIDNPTGSDNGVTASEAACLSGESFLLFDLNEDDLVLADNPGGDADARLNLIVTGTVPTISATIEAKARNNAVPFACDIPFGADATTTVQVQ